MRTLSILVRGPNFQSTPRSRPGWLLRVCVLVVFPPVLAAAQPFTSFPLDSCRVPVPDAADAQATGISFADTMGLVVWAGEGHVKCARLSQRLGLVDSLGIGITARDHGYAGGRVGVASSGQGFLVAWLGLPEVGAAEYAEVAVVSADGMVVRRLRLGGALMGGVTPPAVAFDGANYVVVWSRWDQQLESFLAYYARVTPQGDLLQTARRLAPAHDEFQLAPVVARADTSCLVIWQGASPGGDSGVFCNVIRADGTPADSAGFLVARAPGAFDPAVGFDGERFSVVWDMFDSGEYNLYAARVGQDGRALDTTAVLVARRQRQGDTGGTAVACARETTLVVWTGLVGDSWRTYAARIDRAGRVLDTVPLVLSRRRLGPVWGWHPARPSAAGWNGTFVVVWAQFMGHEYYTKNRDAVFVRVSPAGQVLDSVPQIVSYSANAQLGADVASGGGQFLAVWEEFRPGATPHDPVMFGRRFDRVGCPLDPQPFRLGGNGSRRPSVDFDGNQWGVAFVRVDTSGPRRNDISLVRVTRWGVPVDTQPIIVSHASLPGWPDVASGDDRFLVVWEDVRPPYFYRPYGARVSSSGVLLDSVPRLLSKPPDLIERRPRVAYDGNGVFLVTRHAEEIVRNTARAVRVSSTGDMLDSAEFRVCFFGDSPTEGFARTAYGEGVFFVTALGRVEYGYGGIVTPEGVVTDTALELPFPLGDNADVTFDGVSFLVAGAEACTLRGGRVAPSGVLLDTASLVLVGLDPGRFAHAGEVVSAHVAADSLGFVLATYGAYDRATLSARQFGVAFHRLALGWQPSSHVRGRLRAIPNPASSTLRLPVGPGGDRTAEVRVYDVTGRLVCSRRLVPEVSAEGRDVEIDVRDLAVGAYVLLVGSRGQSAAVRVVR